jgi:hypothetical protein
MFHYNIGEAFKHFRSVHHGVTANLSFVPVSVALACVFETNTTPEPETTAMF